MLCALSLFVSADSTVTISGTVHGASGKHTVHVALWDADGFLHHPVKELQFPPGTKPDFRFSVPAGRWALSGYEDTNDNGKLDMGMFGPKEPSGFFKPFHAWRKPRFEDVSFEAGSNTDNVIIDLHH